MASVLVRVIGTSPTLEGILQKNPLRDPRQQTRKTGKNTEQRTTTTSQQRSLHRPSQDLGAQGGPKADPLVGHPLGDRTCVLQMEGA